MRRLALIAALALAPAGTAISQEAKAAGGDEAVIKTHAIALLANPRCPPISRITLT